jgi:hypothetical protein
MARETSDCRCAIWHEQTHVTHGGKIPKRSSCGNDTFDKRYHKPGNKSS